MALTASSDDQALLLDLQALDTRRQQLDHQTKGLPEHAVLVELSKQAEVLRLTFAEQSGTTEDVTIELSRVESDVAIVEARIARDAERLQSSSSVKDVAAFELEIAALTKRQSDLEEIELTVMEKLENANAALAATTAQLDTIHANIGESEAVRDAQLSAIDAERTHTQARRGAIASVVPGDLLALYEKQRERYGAGASHLRGGVSTASGVKLNSHDMQVIRAAAPDDVLLCPESSAILVRTAESGL